MLTPQLDVVGMMLNSTRIVSLLSLLWSLVEVHCQPAPYVSFMGQTLANHSYVDVSLVGDDSSGSDSVRCITDLSTCCSGTEGPHRGHWYFPNGARIPFPGSGDIYESRDSRRVDLRRRNSAISPTGIYCCDIPTNAVHDETDTSVRETVYMGLYTGSGGNLATSTDFTRAPMNLHEVILISTLGTITISGDVMYDSDQLILACISTGGPATTVSWIRDSTTVITEGNETVLNDPVTAQYTHTLTVTTGGEYTCTVANNKPSSTTSNSITVTGINCVLYKQIFLKSLMNTVVSMHG